MPYSTIARKWTAGGLGVPDLNQFGSDLRSDLGAPTASGAAIARLVATRFAETINLLDYILPTDKDATNGMNRAIARAQSLNAYCVIDVPSGTYVLSGMIGATLSGQQAILLRGAGSAVTRLVQTADADGIRVVIGNYGPAFFDGGAFNVTGLTLEQAAPGSTGKAGLVISTTGVAGNTGKPLVLDDLCFVGRDPGPRWNLGLYFERFGNVAYVSRISVIGCNGGISLNGTSTDYMASAFVRDVTVVGGATALVLGNYLQGIHFENFNSVNTQVCVQCTPTAGLNQEITFVDSYLMGNSVFRPFGTAALNSIRIVGSFFDVTTPPANNTHVTLWDAGTFILSGNTFNGQIGASAVNQTGLFIGGGTGGDQLVTGNQFQSYGSHAVEGTAISIAATANGINFVGNSIRNSSTAVKDLGSGNSFVATTYEGTVTQLGVPGVTPSAVARFLTALNLSGTWPTGTTIASTFPIVGPTLGWNLTNGGGEVDLMLGRQGGSGGLNIYSVGSDGKVEGAAPIAVLDRLGAFALGDLSIAGGGSLGTAWAVTNPTPISATGGPPAATSTVRSRKLGRLVLFSASVAISANSGGGGTVNIALPYASASNQAFGGRNFTNGKGIAGVMVAGSSTLALSQYDGAYPGADTTTLVVSGSYEANA